MSLKIRPVQDSFADMELLEQLNNEAFPECERIPIKKLTNLITQAQIDFSALYDEDLLVGFFVMFYDEKSAYLFFLAIDSSHRSKGYGSKTLQLIRNKYKEYQIVIDIEAIVAVSENYEQRLTRKNFYLKNGCRETNYYMNYVDTTFEILTLSENFDADAFTKLLKKIQREVSTLRGENFQPLIYKKK